MDVIQVENISKLYRLGQIGRKTMGEDLKRFVHKIRGKEDPFLMVGEVNDKSTKSTSGYAWALKEINFKVEAGEIIGVIGKNGAGKSTLLKILSGITAPSKGQIRIRGRIGSLLEVGTGFHPELSGRENIFLNGAILGMTKHEIHLKLDEIIAFSGIEKYIDTPVKRYSSGMMVRLGFAVAAHLEPEILIIDEVLAVGDIEFQRKCLGKIQEVSGHGRTVLFVSHNMNAVQSLCKRGIILENGELVYDGHAEDAVKKYLSKQVVDATYSKSWEINEAPGNSFAKINEIAVISQNNDKLCVNDDMEICIRYTLLENTINRVDVSLELTDDNNNVLFKLATGLFDDPFLGNNEAGKYEVKFSLNNPLNAGVYYVTLRLNENRANMAKTRIDEILSFRVFPKGGDIYLERKGLLCPMFISQKSQVL